MPPGPRQRRALHRTVDLADRQAPRLDLTTPEYLRDRVGTAAALRALDAEHGGGFFDVPAEAALDPAAADECFAALGPVVDVQTHLVRPSRHTTASAAALLGFLRMVEPERWGDPIDPSCSPRLRGRAACSGVARRRWRCSRHRRASRAKA